MNRTRRYDRSLTSTPELHREFDRRLSEGVGLLCDDGVAAIRSNR